jgi:hypothetical protein
MTTLSSRAASLLTMVAAAAGASSCHRKARQADGPTPFQPAAIVQLQHPREAPSGGPIPLEVTLNADARTYWDNQGVLDQALHVLAVRTDAAGVLAIAKVDPAAMVAPPAPLPGRPSPAELAADGSRTVEHKQYDLLAYGRRHAGAASYFVVATFADAWAGPSRLTVTDPGGALPPTTDVTTLPAPTKLPDHQVPSAMGLIVRLSSDAAAPAIIGSFRTRTDQPGELCLTIVLGRLQSTGGALVRQFRVAAWPEGSERVGSFAVPLALLDRPNPAPTTGRYVLFAFVGGEASIATVVEI